MGFPRTRISTVSSSDVPQFIQFDTWVDGRKVEISEESDATNDILPIALPQRLENLHSWMVTKVKFRPRKRTTIRVSYTSAYNFRRDKVLAEYVYGTGSYWKSPIGRAVFTIDGSEIGGRKSFDLHIRATFAARRLDTEKTGRYEIRDFEPEPDACIAVEIRKSDRWKESVRSREFGLQSLRQKAQRSP